MEYCHQCAGQYRPHNFGQDLTPHDERYEWASEYVDVTYKLWEGSWEDGALLQDREDWDSR